MADTKRYSLLNKQPGPRGVQTAQGVVMVQPSIDGASNVVTAELTDDELKLAKKIGLEPTEAVVGGITGGFVSANLPAEGQVDPNTEDGAEAIVKANEKAAKDRAAAAAAKPANQTVVKGGSAGGGVNQGKPQTAKDAAPKLAGKPETPSGDTTDAGNAASGKDTAGKSE